MAMCLNLIPMPLNTSHMPLNNPNRRFRTVILRNPNRSRTVCHRAKVHRSNNLLISRRRLSPSLVLLKRKTSLEASTLKINTKARESVHSELQRVRLTSPRRARHDTIRSPEQLGSVLEQTPKRNTRQLGTLIMLLKPNNRLIQDSSTHCRTVVLFRLFSNLMERHHTHLSMVLKHSHSNSLMERQELEWLLLQMGWEGCLYMASKCTCMLLMTLYKGDMGRHAKAVHIRIEICT
ncbi:hypothetical protein BCR39DRAFT_334588 [Naematelia encephala]|uniref:Uncharacterized protein n=1 Tax=Naematelia encephala TaxID=71784 RepID=A0A1Y2ANV9_9TREE|nr:hypothetical protein BCR39DRAFT_334588 [Naematelia encephala]